VVKAGLRQWIEGLVARVDQLAGEKAVNRVTDRIYAGMSWKGDKKAALDTAVSAIGRTMEELRGVGMGMVFMHIVGVLCGHIMVM